ncbi:unnamed protein product [Fusarium langsethiae]|nr:unnamed protein product [Fusarium langsethiae]
MEAQNSTPDRHDDRTKYRCAIIGSGLAGLTTCYLLQGDERYNNVTVFEQADRLSFDSASLTVKNDTTNDAERIDLPMRASAGGYYHHLMRMYQHLEIPLHPIKFLFVFSKATPTADGTVSHKASDNESYFIHASNLHQTPPPWPGNRGLIAHITEILYLIVCQFWFTIACFLVAPLDATSSSTGYGESLSEYFDRIRLPRRYISHYLLPLLSGVATCTHEEMLLLRATFRVVEAVPQPDGTVVVRWQSTLYPSGRILEQVFDCVILSVSPDVAGRIFKPLRSTLDKFPTRQVESSVLKPEASGISVVKLDDARQAFACMHHSRDPSAAQTMTLRTLFPDTGSAQTNALHTMPSGVVVSTCPLREAAQPDAIKKARFTRTLRSVESQALVQELMGGTLVNKKQADSDDRKAGWVNGQDNVWVAGAWCWDGMVLLEGCIESARRIALDFGVAIPWEKA